MVGSLAKYIERSPRYILQPEDNTLIRMAGPQQIPWEEGTEIQNISLTGLAFTAPADLCPILGEVVRIQFAAPQASQMACHALVVRMDSLNDSTTLVGVRFTKLDFAQRLFLAHHLSMQLREQQEMRRRERFRTQWKMNVPRLVMAWFFLGVWMITLWMWLSGFLMQATQTLSR